MKQLKFLKDVTLDGKAIWYQNCIYDCMGEFISASGLPMYKLISEDLQPRGIYASLEGNFYNVIEKVDNTTNKSKTQEIIKKKPNSKKSTQKNKADIKN